MNRFAILAIGLTLLLCAPLANAALTIDFSIDGGSVTACGSGPDDGPVSCSISSGGIAAQVVTGTSNSPGVGNEAELLGDTVQVTSSRPGTHTLMLWFTAQDFNQPVLPSILTGSLSTTATSANTVSSASLISCVDDTNGTAPPLGCSGGTVSNAIQTDTGSGATSGTSTAGATPTALFSLQQALTLTLKSGSDFNIVTSTSLAVPEPASFTLFGGLALLAGSLVRRRAKRAV